MAEEPLFATNATPPYCEQKKRRGRKRRERERRREEQAQERKEEYKEDNVRMSAVVVVDICQK